MLLRFDGEDEDADPKDVSSILLLTTVNADDDEEIIIVASDGSPGRFIIISGSGRAGADKCDVEE